MTDPDELFEPWKNPSALLRTVALALQERGTAFDPDGEGTGVRFLVHTSRAAYRCHILTSEELQTVVCNTYFPAKAGEERRTAACEALMRANYGLIVGSFEMDFRDGEIRYRTSVDVEGGELVEAMVRNLVSAGVGTSDRYHDAIMRVLYGGSSPEAAIREAEAA